MKTRARFFFVLLIVISVLSSCNISHLGNSVSSDDDFASHDSSLNASVPETSENSNSSDNVASSNSSLNTSVSKTNGDSEHSDVYTFSLLRPDQKGGMYKLLYKKNNSEWKELISGIDSGRIIGIYDNKLYLYDLKGIFYVDLEDRYKVTRWLDFMIYEHWKGFFEPLGFTYTAIVGDDLYFTYTSSTGGESPKDGLMKISMNATSIEDATQFSKKADFKFTYYKDKNVIYYIEPDYLNRCGSLYEYSVQANQKKLLLSGIEDFELYDNKMLYLMNNEDLHIYDVNNGEDNFIYHSPSGNINSGCLWSFADYLNNSVYYKDGDNIMRHDLNGDTFMIYTYSPSHGGTYFYGFDILDDNIIELVLQLSEPKYLVDGSLRDKLPSSYSSQVKLLDGTVASYANNLFGPTCEYKK